MTNRSAGRSADPMLTLLLRANNRWPRTVGFVLNLSSGVYTERAFRKLVELAAPILVPASALRLPRANSTREPARSEARSTGTGSTPVTAPRTSD